MFGEMPLILVQYNGTSGRTQKGMVTGMRYAFKSGSALYVDIRDWPSMAQALTQDGEQAFQVVAE